jgi:hypothetical protein
VLLCALRRLGLQGTALARAQCGSIFLQLLKIGTRVRVSVCRIWLPFSESYPYAALFRQVPLLAAEQTCAPRPCQHLRARGNKSGLAPEIFRRIFEVRTFLIKPLYMGNYQKSPYLRKSTGIALYAEGRLVSKAEVKFTKKATNYAGFIASAHHRMSATKGAKIGRISRICRKRTSEPKRTHAMYPPLSCFLLWSL